jgi:hypothetical protein
VASLIGCHLRVSTRLFPERRIRSPHYGKVDPSESKWLDRWPNVPPQDVVPPQRCTCFTCKHIRLRLPGHRVLYPPGQQRSRLRWNGGCQGLPRLRNRELASVHPLLNFDDRSICGDVPPSEGENLTRPEPSEYGKLHDYALAHWKSRQCAYSGRSGAVIPFEVGQDSAGMWGRIPDETESRPTCP